MANLKEVRNRIDSVNSTKQITSAMKMVSAAKLKKAQDAIVQFRPYANKLQEIIQNVSATLDQPGESKYSIQRDVQNVLVLAITSNRGLCGSFNANVIKETNRIIQEHSSANCTVLSVGKKGFDYYKKTDYNIKGTTLPRELNDIWDDLSYNRVSEEIQKVMDGFVNKDFDKVFIVYNAFKNAGVQIITREQILPISENESTDKSTTKIDYIFEPEREEIIERLIPQAIKTQFYKGLLDSLASEHGARMTAMHKATDNAEELIKELKLTYNKARQAAITGEILEIVGGAEALDD